MAGVLHLTGVRSSPLQNGFFSDHPQNRTGCSDIREGALEHSCIVAKDGIDATKGFLKTLEAAIKCISHQRRELVSVSFSGALSTKGRLGYERVGLA